MNTFDRLLVDAVNEHDLLCHPFYEAWSKGTLTRDHLASYAAQYRHQVSALPALLRKACQQATDHAAQKALESNLDEEEGRAGPAHAALWDRFAAAVGA